MTRETAAISFGVLCAIVALIAALGVAFPSLRGRWRGRKFSAGATSSAGTALVFGTVGAAFVFAGLRPSTQPPAILLVPLVVGFVLLCVGYQNDRKSP